MSYTSMKSLLGLKLNFSIEEFCKQFYNSQILGHTYPKTDKVPFFWELVYDSLANKFSDFHRLDLRLFKSELVALHMVLLGLALIEHLGDNDPPLESTEISSCLGSMVHFMKQHLKEKGDIDVWHAMIAYINSLMELKRKETKIIEKRLGLGNKRLEVSLAAETEYTNNFIDKGLDNDSALYSARQMLVGGSWLADTEAECLANEFTKRLEINTCPDSQALISLLSGIIQNGIYFYAKDRLENVLFRTVMRRKRLFQIIAWAMLGLVLFWFIYLDAPPAIVVVENDQLYTIIKERPVTRGIMVISREYYESLLSDPYAIDRYTDPEKPRP